MKYLILILGIYLIYRFYFNKPANLQGKEQQDDILSSSPNRTKEKSEAEDYIDYEELD